MSKTVKSSGMIDTRLYNHPLFLAKILRLLDGTISSEEKEIIKDQFLIDKHTSGKESE